MTTARSTSQSASLTARAACASARAQFPLSDSVVDALVCSGIPREAAFELAELAGTDVSAARDADAARVAKAEADRTKWDTFWSQYPEHRAEGEPAPEPPPAAASCPRRGDLREAVIGMTKDINQSKSFVHYGDVPFCTGGHRNATGSTHCQVCGELLMTESARQAAAEQASPPRQVIDSPATPELPAAERPHQDVLSAELLSGPEAKAEHERAIEQERARRQRSGRAG